MKHIVSVFILVVAVLVAGQHAVHAEPVFAVDVNNTLLRFDSSQPGVVTTIGAITGLQAGEQILGIDFRPASQLTALYGLGSGNNVYLINTFTGAATAVTGGAAFALNGGAFGVDFNPVPDRIRVISDADQSLRLNPNNGALAGTDTPVAYAAGDSNAGANPNIVGAAYTNSAGPTATATTLFDIDSNLDILVRQGGPVVPPGQSPNLGVLNTIGALGVDTSDLVGFDISGNSGLAFASLTLSDGFSDLYTIDLATGAATLIGDIGDGSLAIRGIAVSAVPEPGTIVLFGCGIAGLLGYGWRRRRHTV